MKLSSFFVTVAAALLQPSTVHSFAPHRHTSSLTVSSSPTTFANRVVVASAPRQDDAIDNEPLDLSQKNGDFDWSSVGRFASTVTSAVVVPMMTTSAAYAAGPDWGLFEGRTGSLIHPVVMGGLFLYTLYTAFLGFQWRRQRTMGDEISELKAQLPKPSENEEGEAPPKTAQQIETEKAIQALQQERKDLAAANPRDKHFGQGSFLAFLGTAIAIEGCLNTYGRAGKLFPGPHLYGGAAVVVLWALAAATVPAMQKGSDTARTIHISANLLSLALFAWQVSSGLPILFKVIDLTSWP